MPRSESTWNDSARSKRPYPKLDRSLSADVIIIGAGITGILSAYLLSQEGKRVVVLEKDTIGSGVTAYTTAFITESIDTAYTDLLKALSLPDAQQVIRDQEGAIKLLAKIVRKHAIDCDFKRVSTSTYATTEEDMRELKEEYMAAKKLGVNAFLRKSNRPLGFPHHGYLEIPGQALFHPLKFVYALAEIAHEQGTLIFEHTPATSLEAKEGGAIVQTNHHTISAPWAISATYEPFNEPLRLYFEKGMYLSYIFELSVKGILLKEGAYEDTANPYHFFRIEKEGNGDEEYRVIVGGEDHRKDFHVSSIKSFNALKRYADTLFPPSSYTIRRKWRGGVLEPIDGLPLIGPMNDDPVLYASAFSGTGMTYAAIAAGIFDDLVNGRKSVRHALYSPKRIVHLSLFMRKARDYAGEIAGAAIKNTFSENAEPLPKTE